MSILTTPTRSVSSPSCWPSWRLLTLSQFKRKYGWDEAAFSSEREGENTSGSNANIPGRCSSLRGTYNSIPCADDIMLSLRDSPACHLRNRAQEFLGRALATPVEGKQPIAYESISRCHRRRVFHGRPE